MATKTLAEKLQIRPGYTVALLNAPKGAIDLLKPLPAEVQLVTELKSPIDLILLFVTSSAELEKEARIFKTTLGKDVVLWFAYPKLASKVASDLTRDKGWQPIYDMGFEGVASIAIDDTWSGIRFRPDSGKSEGDALESQYAGARAIYRPLYEQLVAQAKSLGDDVELAVRKSYVAFTRGKQFALVMPSRDRLDLALKLPAMPQDVRLESAAGVGSGSMTHRIVITKAADIDEQVKGWLQQAYDAAGK